LPDSASDWSPVRMWLMELSERKHSTSTTEFEKTIVLPSLLRADQQCSEKRRLTTSQLYDLYGPLLTLLSGICLLSLGSAALLTGPWGPRLCKHLQNELTAIPAAVSLTEMELNVWSLSPVPVMWLSPKGELIKANEAAMQMMGGVES